MFTVVIPSKTASNLIACVGAIRKHEPGAEIVVVDDGIDTYALEGHDANFHPMRWIRGEKPFIFSRNINAGVREAIRSRADVEGFVFCNDDCLLTSDGGFTAMHAAAKANPQYGCIGAVTNLTGQPLQWPKGVGLREVPHIAYVCVYVPRSTMENVQWMDERYCLDYGVDDRDHCEAIARAGLKVGVHDFCYVDHGSLVSSFRGDPKAPRSFARNYELFKQKWGIQ
jgi:glycosyltransferase involved in cell wall biosynthesis